MIEEITVEESTVEEITVEEIAQHYKACLDSLSVINDIDSDEDDISRNVEHLKLMVAKEFWTDQDFTEINTAIQTA